MRMLPPSLWRNIRHGSFEQLQQRLLHAFSRDIPRDRRVIRFAGDFVDFVDKNDSELGPGKVVIRGLEQLDQDVFHILANVTGFGECRGIDYGERNLQDTGQGLRQQSFSGPGRPDHEYVAFVNLDVARFLRPRSSFVMIIHGDRQRLFRVFLTYDVLIEPGFQFSRRRQPLNFDLLLAGDFFFKDLVAQLHALIADIG